MYNKKMQNKWFYLKDIYNLSYTYIINSLDHVGEYLHPFPSISK